jgi:CBS-domain-containing membrane protein
VADPLERLSPRPLAELVRRVEPLRESDDLAHAADRIAAAAGGLPVVDGTGRLVGYLGERDLLEALFPPYLQQFRNTEFLTRDFPSLLRRAREAAKTTVADHMSRDPVAVDVDDSESHAAELFLHHGLWSLPVIDAEGRVAGVVRLADMIQSLLRACGALPPGPSGAEGGARDREPSA